MEQEGLPKRQMEEDKANNLAETVLYRARIDARRNKLARSRRHEANRTQREETLSKEGQSVGITEQRPFYPVQEMEHQDYYGAQGKGQQSQYYQTHEPAQGPIQQAQYYHPAQVPVQRIGRPSQFHHQMQQVMQGMVQQPQYHQAHAAPQGTGQAQYYHQAQGAAHRGPPQTLGQPAPTEEEIRQAHEAAHRRAHTWMKDDDDLLRWMVSMGKHPMNGY